MITLRVVVVEILSFRVSGDCDFVELVKGFVREVYFLLFVPPNRAYPLIWFYKYKENQVLWIHKRLFSQFIT